MKISPGSTGIISRIQIVDDLGLPVTGLVAATFPTTYYQRAGSAPVAITLADLAAQNSVWASGGVKELNGGYYRLDIPDAAFATECKDVGIVGEATDKRIIHPPIQVGDDKVGGFSSAGLAALNGIKITWRAPTLARTTIDPPVIRGRDYSDSDGASIDIQVEGWTSFAGAIVQLQASGPNGGKFYWTGSVVNEGEEVQTLRFEPTDEDTLHPEGVYTCQCLVIMPSGRKLSPAGEFQMPLIGQNDLP